MRPPGSLGEGIAQSSCALTWSRRGHRGGRRVLPSSRTDSDRRGGHRVHPVRLKRAAARGRRHDEAQHGSDAVGV